jgi:hypothetical protein
MRPWLAEPWTGIPQNIDQFALLEGINSEADEYLTMKLQNENEQTFNVPKERITCVGSVRTATRRPNTITNARAAGISAPTAPY